MKISDVTLTKNNGKVMYFIPEKMTGKKFIDFKRLNKEKIDNFVKK